MRLLAPVVLLAAATLLYAEADLQVRLNAQAATDKQRDFSTAALTAPPTSRWPTNGGNFANQRWSPLTAINRTNVAQLKGVWRARLRGSGMQPQYSAFAAPLVDDGVAYVSTGANDVFALSIDTGEILWQWWSNVDPNITSVCCGWNNKGVALSDDKVFQGLLDGRLVAIDRATGKLAWSIQAERWQEQFSITAAPLYVDGMVVIGFAGGDRGTRSRLKAYDAKDGRLLWTFYTIPGPGEPGHDTWPKDNDAWKYGGAAIWQTPAYDPDLGLLFFSTGNAAPDYNGANRAGDNLYAASMLAIEARTGKYRWHFQQVHHDIWDYDAVNPVVLMDVRMGGRVRKAVVEVGKTGWAYILDRETGKPLIGIDEKPVPQEPRQATAKTQPFPRGDAIVPQFIEMAPEGQRLVNDGRIFTPFVGNDAVIVAPGIWGGASWPPSSYDPVQQRLFVCASSVINGYTGGGDPKVTPPVMGNSYLGGGTTFTRVARTGIIAAVDVTTNKLAWRFQWPEQCYSGTLATAGGLLFVGRNDGRLTALDSASGKQLWEFQTGAGMHAPVATFERTVDGIRKQYVLAYSGGSALLGSARGDSLWLFAVDGTMGPAQAGSPVPRNAVTISEGRAPAAPAASLAAANVENGRKLFVQACAVCHGEDGKSGHGAAPSLATVKDLDFAMRTVTTGRNTMPAFRDAFTAEQIRDVSAYVAQVLAGASPK
ncbi:MAG TPA: PQQ-binding-like beta-propeller repeat protein [Vicinamibacterales bacterium]|nr:PQQ-binding-like beta-propeller repeat protein [Vicinamibacterales bacterium]